MLIEPWTVEMLGGLRARQRGRAIERFRTRQVASLLAYLAYFPDRSTSRDELAEMLWPRSDVDRQRQYLRQALYFLRRHVETTAGQVIQADFAGIRLRPQAVLTDVSEFLRVSAPNTANDRERLGDLARGIELYRGPLLPEMDEPWIEPERQRLRDLYLGTLRRLIRANAEAREYDNALEFAHRAVRDDPYREEFHHALVRLYAAIGRADSARNQFAVLKERMSEIGAAPSSTVTEFISKLADSSRPYPVSTDEPRSTSPPAQRPAIPLPKARPLPIPFTRLFGRDREREAVGSLILSSGVRIVTLTGPGGIGKTRLSLEVARDLRDSLAGSVYFVPLADLRDHAAIADSILASLPMDRLPGQSALDQAAQFLTRNPSLLVMDNYEHLVPEGKATILALLKECEGLRILVSSRMKLRIAGEREFKVPLLPIPVSDSIDEVVTAPSIELFIDRAQGSRPDFRLTHRNAAVVAGICRKLEGLPLAIELAAARLSTLTPSQILSGLEDRFQVLSSVHADKTHRHRSLWTTIDWTYDLLPEDLKRFFASVSVFRGGWTPDAAANVAVNGGEPVESERLAQEMLERLRGHSLIEDDESEGGLRYRMLETIREFASERSLECELTSDSARRRHLKFFLALAEEAEPHLTGALQKSWLVRLETEHDNLRAALSLSSQSTANLEDGVRLVGAIWRFWFVRGYLDEGRRWLATHLNVQQNCPPSLARAKALSGAGEMAQFQGDCVTARRHYEEALSIWSAFGDRAAMAGCMNQLGNLARDQSDYAIALEMHEESLAICRELDDRSGIASALSSLGNLAKRRADFVEARTRHEESLAIRRELGDRRGIALTLNNLGVLAREQGDYEAARALHEESLAIRRDLEDRPGLAAVLSHLGNVAHEQGDFPTARAFHEETLEIRRELGDRRGLAMALNNLGNVARDEGDLSGARGLYEQSLSQFRELNDRSGKALSIENLGNLARERGDYAEARSLVACSLGIYDELGDRLGIAYALERLAAIDARLAGPCIGATLWGASERLREEIAAPLPPNERASYRKAIDAALFSLNDDSAFDRAWKDGRALPLEEVLKLARIPASQ